MSDLRRVSGQSPVPVAQRCLGSKRCSLLTLGVEGRVRGRHEVLQCFAFVQADSQYGGRQAIDCATLDPGRQTLRRLRLSLGSDPAGLSPSKTRLHRRTVLKAQKP
jgi:hypothetical protein